MRANWQNKMVENATSRSKKHAEEWIQTYRYCHTPKFTLEVKGDGCYLLVINWYITKPKNPLQQHNSDSTNVLTYKIMIVT